MIASQYAFIQNPTNRVLTGITLVIVAAFGWWLVRSVKAEVRQRELLAKLNVDLQNAIKQRESLVHLVTHKVKGSFTRSKYIFAELLEGTFGPISAKVKNIAQQGLDSDNEGIATVDLVLNAANFQAGKVKFDMKPLDFKKIVEEAIQDKKGPAKHKNLKLAGDLADDDFTIMGDAFWLKEIVYSLIDNAVKYTLRGGITVKLYKATHKILFSVKDTGVGITDEDKVNLFKEGGRGKDSLRINVDSTGYGLYTVRMIIEAHGGRAWAESEGKDKGSIFYLELPLAQK
ncbi:MAG: HAMP domain-containing sensor histidine kinase [Patescibacteria group bacterium]|nr:HAMP domain-containing sensor histidine kinase [Patescibacteria group bacterium]